MTDLFEIEAPTTTTSLELRRLQREERRRRRRLRTLAASAVALVIFALGASIAWSFVQALRPPPNEVADYTGVGQGMVQIVINPGEDGRAIADTLLENGVIASTGAFILEWNDNQDAARLIQPGYYLLQREMKAEYALQYLMDPDRRLVTNITIPEGWTEAKILDRVASVTGYSLEEVQTIAANTEALGLPEEAGGNLEGWLFPETYSFNPGVNPTDVLAEMVSTTVSMLEDKGVPRDQWERTLIIASIVEREAKIDSDRPLVASVIENRLKNGMALELCSTVNYFTGRSGIPTASELQTANPYNTYINVGLPPGPIASPGEASIDAAITPAQTDYLFFATVNLLTGETRFAATFPEHLQNVELLHQWCRENDGEC
jgi:UPF0755 protein